MPTNTIGVIARRAGVGVETVRFYERRGLIKQPTTPRHGFRQYPDDAVDRIRFIRHAKSLGFTLAEIGDLLALRAHPRINCETVQRRAMEKLESVDAKIRALHRIKSRLQMLANACNERDAASACPILEALQ